MRLKIDVQVDSRPPFDGERYFRWEVFREDKGPFWARRVFAMGWLHSKAKAMRMARWVRAELMRTELR